MRPKTNKKKVLEESTRIKWESKELWECNPNCKHEVKDQPGGGVKCIKCGGWFCY